VQHRQAETASADDLDAVRWRFPPPPPPSRCQSLVSCTAP
jgi:hypothetical protein